MSQPRDKPPAWIDVRSSPSPEFDKVRPDEERAFRELFGAAVRCERACFGERFLGVYRVQLPERAAAWHLRTCDQTRVLDVRRQCGLATWLGLRGIRTPLPTMEPTPAPTPIGPYVYAHEFVPTRSLSSRSGDLAKLADALAAFHKALSSHPDATAWRASTRSRLTSLLETRAVLAETTTERGPEPERLRQLAQREDLDFVLADLPSQPLHGDLNYANALVADQDGGVWILDLEDVFHSVLPRVFEVALALERFIFVWHQEDETALSLACEFLDRYAGSAAWTDADSSALWRGILSLNLRSLCVLASLEAVGADQPQAEWRKFFSLFDDAAGRRRLWEALR